ncbi:MAG: hypothetical protein HY899_05265 [Deltaproteobacteria bacterium]|nr:hypothetical protein [Deltaproteobacteria bacterium]
MINVIHVGRLEMFARIPGYRLVVPDHVREEITVAEQREVLDAAVAGDALTIASLTNLDSIALFTQLIEHVGRGEAACLALALEHGWILASDERKRFRREAESRLGKERLIGTPDLFILAIRAGLHSIEGADADKAVLERRRFKMAFASFRDLLGK